MIEKKDLEFFIRNDYTEYMKTLYSNHWVEGIIDSALAYNDINKFALVMTIDTLEYFPEVYDILKNEEW